MENFFSTVDVIKLYILPWGINIVSAIVIFYVGRWLSKLLTRASKSLMEKSRVDESLRVLKVYLVIAFLIQFFQPCLKEFNAVF